MTKPDGRMIQQITGHAPQKTTPLHGGMIGDVYKVVLANGEQLVAKTADQNGTLHIEGRMLRYLAENSDLPVPDVLHSAPDLLLMTFIEGSSTLSIPVQQHLADLLVALHSVHAEHFGLQWASLIGPLHQPNTPSDRWIPFFREHRLLYMAHIAYDAGNLPRNTLQLVKAVADKLDDLLEEPERPSLIHGDLWTTNVLAKDGRVSALIDPAIYYAHPEIELAYTTLFGTLGDVFFARYREQRPITPGFFETRRDIYNLYPLLVHVHLFGGGYVRSVDAIARRFA